MKILRTASCGVLIEFDGVSVLIDGGAKGIGPYIGTSEELRNKFIIDCKEIQDYIYDKHTELKEYVSESNILTLNN